MGSGLPAPTRMAAASSRPGGPELGPFFNLVVSALAAGGVIAPLTNVVSNLGFVFAPLIYLLSALWATYASLTLIKASTLAGGDSMSAVARTTMGSTAGVVVEGIVIANAFFQGIAGMAAWSDLWDRDMTEGLDRAQFLAVGAAVLAPLMLMIRSMQACELLSIVTLISTLLFLGTVVVRAVQPCVELPELTPCNLNAGTTTEAVNDGVLYAFVIALNSFVVHFNVLDIYHSTVRLDVASGGELSTPVARSFSCQIYTSMGTVFAIYCALSTLSYASFGPTDYADILRAYKEVSTGGFTLSFPALGQLLSIPLVSIPAIKLLACRLLPVIASMRRTPPKTEASALVPQAEDDAGWAAHLAHMLVATVWTLGILLVCMAYGGIEVILGLFGTLCGVPLLAILPPLLVLQCESMRQGEQRSVLLHRVMLVAGVVVTIVGIVVSARRVDLDEDRPDDDIRLL